MANILLTPGPLTTSAATRRALDRDWGSRDGDFIALTERVRDRLRKIAEADERYTCVPLQGSGTFAVEAAVQTLVPREGKVLVLINGAYGHRMAEIAKRLGRDVDVLECEEDCPISSEEVDSRLAYDAAITDVMLVHCETTSGILNPLEQVAAAVQRHGRRLLLDAMSSFGAIPVETAKNGLTAVMASANKCLEGVPGVAFVIVEIDTLKRAKDNAVSLSLDLEGQWRSFEANGQWRFTPPTQVLAALDAALDQHETEGGIVGRGRRYAENCRVLINGMRAFGFRAFLNQANQAPIIATFAMPTHPNFVFNDFHDRLHSKGYVIYPGKLTRAASFRIGCIGAINVAEINGLISAIALVLEEMAVPAGLLYPASSAVG